MRKVIGYLLLFLMTAITLQAQERKVQNRPYADLRKFHFGILVGTHAQDIELMNAGPQLITYDDGTTVQSIVTVDQDRWDPGFHVGVLGELRLNENFQLRLAPAMYFGTRHFTFHNFTPDASLYQKEEEYQDLKSAYISSALELIFAAPRFNNYRPYLMGGINPMLNLSRKDDDYLKLKGMDTFLEIGVGCDFYLPYFKARPELKFMYGLSNCLDTDHAKNMRNKNMLRFTNAVSEAHSKMITFTVYFE